MDKVIIIGSPGAGKSYFAKQLGILTGLMLHHLDNLYWHEDRTHISHDELVEKLKAVMLEEKWIIDGNYKSTMEQRLRVSDTVFFLDYSTEQCIRGITERLGQKRDDIPWMEDKVDEELFQFVMDYQSKSKPKIEELLTQYANKKIIRLKDRQEALRYLIGLFPDAVSKYVRNLDCKLITEAHCSGDLVYKFGDGYILKVSKNIQRLERERTVNDFLKGKIPVSETVEFVVKDKLAFYLKTCVNGEPLIGDYLKEPVRLARMLSDAMKLFHSIDISGCDITNLDSEGNCFIHGDFCLPNILAEGNRITGFIDTEAAGIGDPWMDYAWCLWSYEYNLGTKEHTQILLDELGIEFDQDKFNLYVNV